MANSRLAAILGGNRSTRAMLRALLREHDCMVREFADLAALADGNPTSPLVLIVIASRTGGDDVIATLAGLHRLGYRGPTVLLAHSATADLRRRAFALGAADVASLPTNVLELRARLRVAIREGAADPSGDAIHEHVRLPA